MKLGNDSSQNSSSGGLQNLSNLAEKRTYNESCRKYNYGINK